MQIVILQTVFFKKTHNVEIYIRLTFRTSLLRRYTLALTSNTILYQLSGSRPDVFFFLQICLFILYHDLTSTYLQLGYFSFTRVKHLKDGIFTFYIYIQIFMGGYKYNFYEKSFVCKEEILLR